MNKEELLNQINHHPKHTVEKFSEFIGERKTTNRLLLDYIFLLEDWVPLEVRGTNHCDFYRVASQTDLNTWYFVDSKQKSCQCAHGAHQSEKKCAHVSAVEKFIEDLFTDELERYSFRVFYVEGCYCIRKGKASIGIVREVNCSLPWHLTLVSGKTLEFARLEDIPSYIVSADSFGWQLA